jgi:hypothetical protein
MNYRASRYLPLALMLHLWPAILQLYFKYACHDWYDSLLMIGSWINVFIMAIGIGATRYRPHFVSVFALLFFIGSTITRVAAVNDE